MERKPRRLSFDTTYSHDNIYDWLQTIFNDWTIKIPGASCSTFALSDWPATGITLSSAADELYIYVRISTSRFRFQTASQWSHRAPQWRPLSLLQLLRYRLEWSWTGRPPRPQWNSRRSRASRAWSPRHLPHPSQPDKRYFRGPVSPV